MLLTVLKTEGSIRAVFFDAVGTLLLPADPVADTYRATAMAHGADVDLPTIRARLLEAFQIQERLDREMGWKTDEHRELARWRAIVDETLREAPNLDECLAELWNHYSAPASWRLQDETGPVLNALEQKGFILGMASNFDGRLTGIVESFAELAPLKSRCVVSSVVGWRKPSTRFFQEVIRQAGCPAAEILYVGDDLRNDFEGAQRAGLRALLFQEDGGSAAAKRISRLSELL